MKTKLNSGNLILLAACCLFCIICTSGAQFRLAVGGLNSDDSHSIVKTSDGGFAVAGATSSYGLPGANAYILKFGANGSLQWSRSIGGVGSDGAYAIIQTSDGGFATAGSTASFGAGNYDMYVIKLDANGNLQWNKVIGGPNNDYGYSILQMSDGGYIVTGSTASFGLGNNDILVAKLSASGVLQWSKTGGGNGSDYGFSTAKTTDGGFVTAGMTTSFGQGGYDMFLVKFSSAGIIEWSRMVGGSGYDGASSVIQTSDGNYVMAGSTMTFGTGNSHDMYIVKISSSGSLIWTRTLGSSYYEFASSVIQTTDGGYCIAGSTESPGAGGSDFYIAKLSSSGSVQWQKTTGGSNNDYGYTVIQTPDGGYSITGYTESFGSGNADVFIAKFSSTGSICGNSSTPSLTSGSGGITSSILPISLIPSVTVLSPAPIVVSGGSVATVCLTGIQPVSNEIPVSYQLFQNYPNPFNPVTNIKFSIPKSGLVKLTVFDIAGKEVASLVDQHLNSGSYDYDFDASNLASGAYFYRLTAGGFIDVKKMMLVK